MDSDGILRAEAPHPSPLPKERERNPWQVRCSHARSTRWNKEKSDWLKSERGISFDMVLTAVVNMESEIAAMNRNVRALNKPIALKP